MNVRCQGCDILRKLMVGLYCHTTGCTSTNSTGATPQSTRLKDVNNTRLATTNNWVVAKWSLTSWWPFWSQGGFSCCTYNLLQTKMVARRSPNSQWLVADLARCQQPVTTQWALRFWFVTDLQKSVVNRLPTWFLCSRQPFSPLVFLCAFGHWQNVWLVVTRVGCKRLAY